MYEKLVEKKGIMYSTGKKPYTGRVFDNYRMKGRKFTGAFRNGKKHGNWTYWKENGKTDREESYFEGNKNGNWVYYNDNGIKEKLRNIKRVRTLAIRYFIMTMGKKKKRNFMSKV
ncbi:MAG: hypothetical protein Ct9H300mP18_10300 [Candidatus Neomarinimicrobiota bacterium]|nr:MAG: hypothetical protein Ct9H300mP18_10300 [Candidatus Neomarinimicrobiota bacterium]